MVSLLLYLKNNSLLYINSRNMKIFGHKFNCRTKLIFDISLGNLKGSAIAILHNRFGTYAPFAAVRNTYPLYKWSVKGPRDFGSM